MKFVEFTILSSVDLLEKYAPSYYRSNKIIVVCGDEKIPQRYRGNYCYSIDKCSSYYGFSFSVKNGQLFINKKGEQKIVNVSSEFAVKVSAPQAETIEYVGYTMLYSSDVEQEVVASDLIANDAPIIEEVKNEPVLLEEEQEMEVEEEEQEELEPEQEIEEELYESEEELEEEEFEEDDYDESEG